MIESCIGKKVLVTCILSRNVMDSVTTPRKYIGVIKSVEEGFIELWSDKSQFYEMKNKYLKDENNVVILNRNFITSILILEDVL
jgi:hypothetical protein